jgi:hypothetical protein
MGNTESNQEDSHEFDGCETLGYRVLGVQPNSPAARAGLVSFFDFLVGANGQLLFGINAQEEASRSTKKNNTDDEYFEDVDFPALLKGNVNQEIELCKWMVSYSRGVLFSVKLCCQANISYIKCASAIVMTP